MKRISGIKLLVALASICLVTATVADAAIVELRLNLTTSTGGVLPGAQYSGPGGTFTGPAGEYRVQIQVRIADNVLFNDGTNDYIGGLSSIGYDMLDSTGIVEPDSLLLPKIATGNKWWSSNISSLGDTSRGDVNQLKLGVGYDVLQGFAGIHPDYLGPEGEYNYTHGGSGPDGIPTGTQPAWTTITWGNFIYDGGNAVLSLVTDPSKLSVYTGGGVSGYQNPASVNLSLATLTFGTTTPPNTAPTKPVVVPSEILETSWSKEPGWNNLAHSVEVTASSTDDGNPNPPGALTYEWQVTKPGSAAQILTGETGSVLNLTLAKIVALGLTLPDYVGADDPSYHWMLSVRAYDGELYSAATDIQTFVPEPATIGMLGFGIFGALLRRRRRA